MGKWFSWALDREWGHVQQQTNNNVLSLRPKFPWGAKGVESKKSIDGLL